ncbi:hypothetical protein V1291_004367 [Nitrobacteraceae bacterium AZCC 1564]
MLSPMSLALTGCRATRFGKNLLEAGYSKITQLEADDGHWEGEGVKGGKRVEFHLDPNSGAILVEKPKRAK